jgi:hypothetical protein
MDATPLNRLTRWMKSLKALRFLGAWSSERAAADFELRLRTGANFGDALTAVLPELVADAARSAHEKFDGGAVALLIVDFRDALHRRLSRLAETLAERERPWALYSSARLTQLSLALHDDTVEQHLINTVLECTGAWAEMVAVVRGEIDPQRLASSVVELLLKALPAVFSRHDLSQTLVSLGGGDEHTPPPRLVNA